MDGNDVAVCIKRCVVKGKIDGPVVPVASVGEISVFIIGRAMGYGVGGHSMGGYPMGKHVACVLCVDGGKRACWVACRVVCLQGQSLFETESADAPLVERAQFGHGSESTDVVKKNYAMCFYHESGCQSFGSALWRAVRFKIS